MQKVTQLKLRKYCSFLLSLKRNYSLRCHDLPTISKQCATMLDAILTDHVSAHAMMQ